MFWFVYENCPLSGTELEVHESGTSLLSSWAGNFFQSHILEDDNGSSRNMVGGQGLNTSQDRDK